MTSLIVTVLLIVVGIPVICLTAIIVAATLGFGRRQSHVDPDETRIIQEMHRGIEKLERRIESLETIVLEHEGPSGGAS